jgi:hypothetical protein
MTPDITKYQALKFKIHGKTDAQVAEIIKPLELKYAAVQKLADKPKAQYLATMKYLIYLFDKNTDLNRDFMRLEDRQAEAAKLAGLGKIKDIPTYDGIYTCDAPEVLDVIQILLTQIYHDIDYREWQGLHRELDELNAARWQRIEPTSRNKAEEGDPAPTHNKASLEALKIKSQLREDSKRIRELLEELDQKIFGDNIVIKDIAYKSRFTSPESFAMAVRQHI